MIALDPATLCGYAWTDTREVDGDLCGCWDLSVQRHEGGGMRFLRFREYFSQLIDTDLPCVVFYEEIRRHMGTDAAHIYGGLVSHIQEICESRTIPYRAFPVGTIKKRATGNGSAGKPAMIEAAACEFSYAGENDNEADALWILQLGVDSLSKQKPAKSQLSFDVE